MQYAYGSPRGPHIDVHPSGLSTTREAGSVAGAQAKVLVRKVAGKYVSNFTGQEVAARFAMCNDLLLQLLPYCRRKHAEHPEWTSEQLLEKVATSLRGKGWDVTNAEIEWLVRQLDMQLRQP